MTDFLRKLTDSWPFQAFIVFMIILAGAVVGLETYPAIMERHGTLLHALDRIILWVFAAEIGLRLAACGLRPWTFFRNGWNIMDFLIVGMSLLPFASQSVLVVRLLRLLRLVRLVKFVPEMRLLVETILHTIPSMFYLAALFSLLIYVYAVIGTFAFGANDPMHFGALHISVLSLFQVLTLEGWADIMLINIHGCDNFGYDGHEALCAQPTAHPGWAVAYFISFVMFGTFLMLNMVIGFIMENLQTTKARHLEEARKRPDFPNSGVENRIARIRDDLAALEKEILRKD